MASGKVKCRQQKRVWLYRPGSGQTFRGITRPSRCKGSKTLNEETKFPSMLSPATKG